MLYAEFVNPEEIDYRTIPNWMIPQLSFLRKRLGLIVTSVESQFSTLRDFLDNVYDAAIIRAYLPNDKAFYLFRIYKTDMNDPRVPPMYIAL